jgi:hypothetical protein
MGELIWVCPVHRYWMKGRGGEKWSLYVRFIGIRCGDPRAFSSSQSMSG